MALVGTNGRFLQINEAFCQITGYTNLELLDRSFADITHPDDLALSWGVLKQLLTPPFARMQFEKRYLHKQGHTIWATVASALVRGSSGENTP